jgi:hypothetical protein
MFCDHNKRQSVKRIRSKVQETWTHSGGDSVLDEVDGERVTEGGPVGSLTRHQLVDVWGVGGPVIEVVGDVTVGREGIVGVGRDQGQSKDEEADELDSERGEHGAS